MQPSDRRPTVSVRPYRPEDRAFVLGLAPRLAIGVAPWRDPARMEATMRGYVEADVAAAEAGAGASAVFVAEDAAGARLGFVAVGRNVHFTGEEQAYVGELAVAAEAEGRGAARALMAAAEAWARTRGFALVVLDTGAANTHARAVYAALGYREESVKLVKAL